MANYANLLATIAANIYTNGNQEVTAAMVKTAMNAAINSLGAGYQFMGVATTDTNPGTPDQNVFYIASTPGVYSNFNAIVVNHDEIVILCYNGTWTKLIIGAEISSQIIKLESCKLYGNYVVGSLTNGSLVPSFRFRIASNEILSYDRDIIISANNGYRFGIHYFNDGVFSSDSGWRTSIKITRGETFKIVIGKIPEDLSITANIDEYLSNIFVTNIYDYVDNAVGAVNDKVDLTFAMADATVPKLDVPTRNGSYGNLGNAYAVVWLDIPCAGYDIIRFRVKKQLSATGNVYVFAYSTPTASFWDNIPMNVQYGFYQDSVDKWMELSCAGMQKISIQAYETGLPQQYPTTYTPLRKADFIDGVDGLEYYLLKSVLSQPENMVVEKKRVTTNYGNQGLTIVGNTIVQFVSAADDHSSFADVLRWQKSDFTFIPGMTHNLGHAATIDYNEFADALIVANGTMASNIAPRLDIVLNASDKIANGGQLDYNSNDILHIELTTSAKSISGSGLICCYGGNWREVFLATGQNAPRRIFKCLLGVGNEDFSDTTAEQNDASRWGTFIAGKTNTEYNGTIKIISSYIGEETQTFQGMCYRAGYIYLACGTTRPLIHKIRLHQNGRYDIIQTNLPLDYNPDGSEKTVEPEGLCFYDNGSLLVGMPDYGGLYLIDRF